MNTAKVLCDTYANSGLRLITESTELSKKKVNKNALGCMEGPCSDYSVETRNNNYYSRKLWEKVMDSEYFKEAMETKTLFGEVDHPEGRLELKAENAAICMTDCWFDDDQKCLMGTFDILPTEKGKIVKALCDYGSILGVSSRGIGDIEIDSEGRNIVNEDTYSFVCFDVVVQPAAAKARQTYEAVKESARPSSQPLVSTLLESVSRATEESDLSFVENLVDRVNVPEKDKILESVKSKRDEITKTSANIKTNEILQKDLQEAYLKISELESQVKKPIVRDKTLSELAIIKGQLAKTNKIIESFKNISDKYNSVLEENANLRSDSLLSKKESADLEREIKFLKEQLKTKTKENDKLNEAVDYSRTFVQKCKQAIKTLEKSNKDLKESCTALQKQVKESKSAANAELIEEFKRGYINTKESQYGVDLSTARRRASEVSSIDELDKLISEAVRTSGGISPSKRKPNLSKALVESEDLSETHDNDSVVGLAFSKLYNGGN